MTVKELRQHEEYHKCLRKIEGYSAGFTFTINFTNIPPAKANALRVVLRDACKKGLIESVSIGLGFVDHDLVPMEETYRRKGTL